jgi:hypothetical protein
LITAGHSRRASRTSVPVLMPKTPKLRAFRGCAAIESVSRQPQSGAESDEREDSKTNRIDGADHPRGVAGGDCHGGVRQGNRSHKVLASWLNLDVELMLTGLRAIAGHFSRSHVSAPPNV